jgi:hypothetical protein
MTTASQFPPDPEALAAPMSELISGTFSSPYSDLIAGQLSDATAAVVMLDEAPMPFEDVGDRFAFAVAFTAANTGTPVADVIETNLADFIVWHRQAARLSSGRLRTDLRMLSSAIEALASNPTIFAKASA